MCFIYCYVELYIVYRLLLLSLLFAFYAGVSDELGMAEKEVCGMHDADKLGQSAVGALVRSKHKVAVNPFPQGQALLKKAHAVAVHFNYSNRQ